MLGLLLSVAQSNQKLKQLKEQLDFFFIALNLKMKDASSFTVCEHVNIDKFPFKGALSKRNSRHENL